MPAPEPCDIAYYAFGGGMGHVTRAAAILRHVGRISELSAVVLTNARETLPLRNEGIPFAHLPEADPDALAAGLQAALDALRPSLLAVDVFPCGVVGELARVTLAPTCAKALVCRHLRRPYADELPVHASGFDLALCVEPPPPQLSVPVVDCSPVLLRDAAELLSRTEARAILGPAPHQRVLVAVSTEGAEATARLFSLVARLAVGFRPAPRVFWASPNLQRFAATEAFARGTELRHYPLLELLNGVDVVVGASGYNLYSETVAVGVPAVFIPRGRRYDDQQWRARDADVASDARQLQSLLARLLAAETDRPQRARYTNGAATAAAELVALARRGTAARSRRDG